MFKKLAKCAFSALVYRHGPGRSVHSQGLSLGDSKINYIVGLCNQLPSLSAAVGGRGVYGPIISKQSMHFVGLHVCGLKCNRTALQV